MGTDALEQRAVNVVRGLAMDAVQRDELGSPGHSPWRSRRSRTSCSPRVMRYDAADGDWPDRDRFVLSAGHASMLLYSMAVPVRPRPRARRPAPVPPVGLEDAGSPRRRGTRGASRRRRGPLGQGLAHRGRHGARRAAVLRHRFGRRAHRPPRVRDLQRRRPSWRGSATRPASFAGHFRLGRLVVVYDDNHVTIDGPTELTYSDDVPGRFRSYGWHVLELGEGGRGPRRARARAPGGDGRRGPAVAARAALPHRLPVPHLPGHARGARQPARRRGGRSGEGHPGAPPGGVLGARRRARAVPRGGPAPAHRARAEWEARRRAYAAASRERFDEYEATISGRGRRRLGAQAAEVGARHGGRDARGVRGGAGRRLRRRARSRRRAAPTSPATPAPW
ncbi:MAG: hypothetical protein KatS3mg010_0353 [Acidimicrobiia bacterium]|nr:MAG: hypothetical protein KatS3mg010_0353 [Acidimicrobiia bacterium]